MANSNGTTVNTKTTSTKKESTMKTTVAKAFAAALKGQMFVRIEYTNSLGQKSVRDFCPLTPVFACKYDAITGEPQSHLAWGADKVESHEAEDHKDRPFSTIKLESVKKATLTGERYILPDGKWLIPVQPKQHLGRHDNIQPAALMANSVIEKRLNEGWRYVEIVNGETVEQVG